MSLINAVYRGVFRRTSTYAIAVLGGAILFETYFNELCDKWLAQHNAGKRYADMRRLYPIEDQS
ncbi:uncharacterized protein LOC111137724 [Crassostrea virginica]